MAEEPLRTVITEFQGCGGMTDRHRNREYGTIFGEMNERARCCTLIWKKIFNDAVNGHGAGTVDPIPSSSISEEPQEVRPLCVEEKLPDRPVAMDSCVSAEIVLRMTIESEDQIGRTALLLAATTSSEKETELKKDLAPGLAAVATEVEASR